MSTLALAEMIYNLQASKKLLSDYYREVGTVSNPLRHSELERKGGLIDQTVQLRKDQRIAFQEAFREEFGLYPRDLNELLTG